jgi:uncharacterized membrane protein HdeD (DUF308 family)
MARPNNREGGFDVVESAVPGMLVRSWWSRALRGLLAIIFGVLALAWPGITLFVLIVFFGAFVLVDGLLAVVAGFAERKTNNKWWVLMLGGILGVAIGVVTFVWPGLTALALLFLIAAWAIVTGILQVVLAIMARKEIANAWLLVLEGVVSVIFGVIVAALPLAGALAIVWLIGIWAIVIGLLSIVLAFRLRSFSKKGLTPGVAAA